jgi:hypothetical protein
MYLASSGMTGPGGDTPNEVAPRPDRSVPSEDAAPIIGSASPAAVAAMPVLRRSRRDIPASRRFGVASDSCAGFIGMLAREVPADRLLVEGGSIDGSAHNLPRVSPANEAAASQEGPCESTIRAVEILE